MQKLAEVCIKRPVFAAMLILALVVVGAASYFKLGVDRFPSVDLPTVRVSTRLPGASPAEVEAQVSQRLEEAINTVAGIHELRSISGPGSSFLMVTFGLDRDIETAAQDVRDRVSGVLRDLPRQIDPPVVSKFDNDQSPIMTLALTGNRSQRELTELADKIVKVQIERVDGVGEVEISGGAERAINIWIDSARLAAYQIPITSVRDALEEQNSNMPGGNVTSSLKEQPIRTLGRITEPRDFNDLVVATVNGSPIRVRDLGWAEDGAKEQRSVSRLNGVPTISLEVRRQSGANTVAVIEGVKARFAEVQAQLPGDVQLQVIRDQSRYIYEALHEINRHLVLGSILASLVVLAFMRNWRATLIAAVAIPTSVISTFGMMWALDFTLNSVTMLALVLMVGIVIDDAIVVLENIFRFIEEKKMNPFDAARAATAEIGLAVMATTLSLVVIFVPVSFMSSISGRFLYQFGLTAAVAVLVSLLVSFTLTPMMSARLMRRGEHLAEPSSRRGFYRWIDASYHWLLARAMAHRPWVALFAILVVLSSIPLYKMVRQEYIPGNVDEGEFEVSATAREGASITAMNETMTVLEREIQQVKGVRLILGSIGGSGLFGSVNYARFYVRLAPHSERVLSFQKFFNSLARGKPWEAFQNNYSQRDVMQEIRRRLRKFPELRCSVSNSSSFNLGGSRAEIDFALLGPDLDALGHYAEQLRKKAPEIGVIDADTTLKLDKPELRVVIDRERAAQLGVDTEDIATAVRIMIGGDERVSRFRDAAFSEDYDVQLRLREEDRTDPAVVSRIFIPRSGGGLVRLDNLVRIVQAQTASRIDRLDRRRQVSLRGSVAPGYALADRVQALRDAVAEMNLPAGYTTRVTGRGRELENTFREFIWAFLLSVIFMYMILAAQFESLTHPFTILLSLPLSVPFALLSLWGTGNTLNLYSALGLLVLFGVVKKNAILQIDHMNQLYRGGMNRLDAILQANRDRLRPILMTTLSLVAGMLPLAFGAGPGAEERRAIAVIVIGGQLLALALTLVVTPVAYSYLDDLRLFFKRSRPDLAPPLLTGTQRS